MHYDHVFGLSITSTNRCVLQQQPIEGKLQWRQSFHNDQSGLVDGCGQKIRVGGNLKSVVIELYITSKMDRWLCFYYYILRIVSNLHNISTRGQIIWSWSPEWSPSIDRLTPPCIGPCCHRTRDLYTIMCSIRWRDSVHCNRPKYIGIYYRLHIMDTYSYMQTRREGPGRLPVPSGSVCIGPKERSSWSDRMSAV